MWTDCFNFWTLAFGFSERRRQHHPALDAGGGAAGAVHPDAPGADEAAQLPPAAAQALLARTAGSERLPFGASAAAPHPQGASAGLY